MGTPLGRLRTPVIQPQLPLERLWVARGVHVRAVLRARIEGFLVGMAVSWIVLWWMFMNG